MSLNKLKKQAIKQCNALKSERKNKRNVNFNQSKENIL